ncbi:MAG: class I SAM-dependent methyltransferase [Candidatus Poribacteria bacterium]|nr:class I SAM-dependent methyltransferase [Candidatus Poribacteria bacterium]
MAETTDPTQKENHPFYYQYRAVYEYAAQFTQGQRVLDLGCGEGYGAHLLAQHAKQVVAVDKDKKTIQQAKQKYDLPNLDFYIQDVSQLHKYFPYAFDVICCFHLIEHLTTPEHFLEEVGKRLTNPKAVLLISTPNRDSPLRQSTGLQWPYHECEYNANEFRNLLSRHFRDVVLYTLQGSSKVEEFQELRAQHIHQIFSYDILKMRHWLPKSLLRLSFDVGGRLLKSFISTTHTDLTHGITTADFHVTEGQFYTGLDLIGVCRIPFDTLE